MLNIETTTIIGINHLLESFGTIENIASNKKGKEKINTEYCKTALYPILRQLECALKGKPYYRQKEIFTWPSFFI